MRPGDRVKTDRRDARKLARLYRAGELSFVRPRTRARGTRNARPVRRHAVSSPAKRTAALHVERLVDRLMRDPHRGIIRELEP